jgi:hypothetical protein
MHAIWLLLKGAPLYAPPNASFKKGVSMCPLSASLPRMSLGQVFMWYPAREWPWT